MGRGNETPLQGKNSNKLTLKLINSEPPLQILHQIIIGQQELEFIHFETKIEYKMAYAYV